MYWYNVFGQFLPISLTLYCIQCVLDLQHNRIALSTNQFMNNIDKGERKPCSDGVLVVFEQSFDVDILSSSVWPNGFYLTLELVKYIAFS